MNMKYLIPLLLLVSGCASNSSSEKNIDNCSNLERVVGACSEAQKTQVGGKQNGAVLIGFLLRKMNNKDSKIRNEKAL